MENIKSEKIQRYKKIKCKAPLSVKICSSLKIAGVSLLLASPILSLAGGASCLFLSSKPKNDAIANFKHSDTYKIYRQAEDERLENYYNENVIPAEELFNQGQIDRNELEFIKKNYQYEVSKSNDVETAMVRMGQGGILKQAKEEGSTLRYLSLCSTITLILSSGVLICWGLASDGCGSPIEFIQDVVCDMRNEGWYKEVPFDQEDEDE